MPIVLVIIASVLSRHGLLIDLVETVRRLMHREEWLRELCSLQFGEDLR